MDGGAPDARRHGAGSVRSAVRPEERRPIPSTSHRSVRALQAHDHEKGTSMHLQCPSCRGIHSKDHPGGRGLLVGILLVLVAVSSAFAWNKAGHMVSGAIAYADLTQATPQTLARVI